MVARVAAIMTVPAMVHTAAADNRRNSGSARRRPPTIPEAKPSPRMFSAVRASLPRFIRYFGNQFQNATSQPT